MGQKLQKRIDTWKKLLLDFGKRNRLINFKESKRSNVKISFPLYNELYEDIVVNEVELTFPRSVIMSYPEYLHLDKKKKNSYKLVSYIRDKKDQETEEEGKIKSVVLEEPGDIETSKSVLDLESSLKRLRYIANTSIEEQGINTLFLAFGFLKWKERDDSSHTFLSPIILVPVKLSLESLTSPYKLSIHEDEIVVNPTLQHKLENDFNIILPEFSSSSDKLEDYFKKVEDLVKNSAWSIDRTIHLSAFSFLKINMYHDLERNTEKLSSNAIISAIAGESEPHEVPSELNSFDHDKNIRPIDTFQVVDADSSQQDAIMLSKRGVSFVLQGPPGTGKSQTITNIISEAIADGKKVLFVSEKMAALQVVYNRLSSVGLKDFCFTLHSHKAKKKEILKELASSLTVQRKRAKEDAIAKLNLLEKKRDYLNQYNQELHTNTSNLNTSIFKVNGKLAKLSDVPDVVFGIDDVYSVTEGHLNDRLYILHELSKIVNKRSENYLLNPWREANVDILTNELRHDIDSNTPKVIEGLNRLSEYFYNCSNFIKVQFPGTLNGIDLLIELLSAASKSPLIPVNWIFKSDIDNLLKDAHVYRQISEKLLLLQDAILKEYDSEFLSFDSEKYKASLLDLLDKIQEILIFNTQDEFVNNINTQFSQIKSCKEELENIFGRGYQLADLLGVYMPNNCEKLDKLVLVAENLLRTPNIKPAYNWFDKEKLGSIKGSIPSVKKLHAELIELEGFILKDCDKNIFSVDLYPMLQRFRGEYASIFRVFSSKYREDMRELKKYLITPNNLNFKSALNILTNIKRYCDLKNDIETNTEQYRQDYGQHYKSINTDWDQLESAISSFGAIMFCMEDISSKLRGIIVKGEVPQNEIDSFIEQYKNHPVSNIYNTLSNVLKVQIDNKMPYKKITASCNDSCILLESFIEKYNQLLNCRKDKASFSRILLDLSKLSEYQSVKSTVDSDEKKLMKHFESYYSGYCTNWNSAINALCFAKEFRDYVEVYKLPASFVKQICTDINSVEYCQNTVEQLNILKLSLQKPLNWFISLFDDAEKFKSLPLNDLIKRINDCKDNKSLLEEWVDFRSILKKCERNNLSSYAYAVRNNEVDANYIVEAYLKRFYRLWLDAVLPNFPAVLEFRGRIHNQNVKEFGQLDKGQFLIAQARVKERAFSRMPDFNSITSTRDEVNILKREVNKQRKLMPLRKLFRSIPNLLTSIRPCFMMSPLSVSTFLEADSYMFDLVIFDEASQVHTEDAIGAIMRGKQVIIVGDTQQLPPTNFFTASIADDDMDTDDAEKYDDAGAYESILDEAVSVLPERSLLWHYRSRHEHLIAFSNVKVYNNSLVTFPSSVDKKKDWGVEYIHVLDGIYDRSKKRCNVKEAERVADLVFEHFKHHPERSLGVVTFSEAQQSAIDIAIHQRRIANNYYEKFFIDDKDEPFFIKNLENVQGDERDTIIFSIGYAKDSHGVMHMNFGPLSREGGYRRLNVAITRAKQNVKLVGSIVPTDIDLERTSAEGVKLLRSYIEFAQQGIIALERELSYSSNLEFDSSFEESVYDFLVSRGYQVVTQVGCSGYRIDMAVKHPRHNGEFAIGIECDGATYHSSRTARERDRLRQSVLEDMGWKIYRIWSTDWIKDTKTEREKLITAVDKAINGLQYFQDSTDGVVEPTLFPLDVEEDVVEEEILSESSSCQVNVYGFIPYELADISDFDITTTESYTSAIKYIIEKEQPIHFEELCKRAAPLYGREKVTSVVREEVWFEVNNSLEGIVNKIWSENDFIMMKDFNDLKVRIPIGENPYQRPISHISDDELMTAVICIIQHSFGITPESLLITTARELGYKRSGSNVTKSLECVYSKMKESNIIKEIDGKVHVRNTNGLIKLKTDTPISCLSGFINVDFDRCTFIMQIEFVFKISKVGVMVTGKVIKGEIKAGDYVEIIKKDGDGENQHVSVKDLHSNSKSIQYAIEGDVITAVLNDVLESQLSYGDLLLKRY